MQHAVSSAFLSLLEEAREEVGKHCAKALVLGSAHRWFQGFTRAAHCQATRSLFSWLFFLVFVLMIYYYFSR